MLKSKRADKIHFQNSLQLIKGKKKELCPKGDHFDPYAIAFDIACCRGYIIHTLGTSFIWTQGTCQKTHPNLFLIGLQCFHRLKNNYFCGYCPLVLYNFFASTVMYNIFSYSVLLHDWYLKTCFSFCSCCWKWHIYLTCHKYLSCRLLESWRSTGIEQVMG